MEQELNEILKTGNITTLFQPIISLKDASIIGYEALSRGPKGSPLQFPDKLFEAAAIYNKSWELESLCRTKALEKSSNLDKDKFLFINVDPLIFKDDKFKKGFTKEFLLRHNISPNSIIFEITEKTAIEDYIGFKKALDNYVDQGYQIAIDDTGAGYSGLKTLYLTKPHYIKIDMDLIRDIHKDLFKQALIEALVTFARSTNMKTIAEGIETEEELSALINLGVYAGQGFFIQRPSLVFSPILPGVKDTIIKYNRLINRRYSLSNSYIGQICTFEQGFSPNTSCQTIKEYINKSPAKGVCIIEDEKPVGSVMNSTLDSVMAAQYGFSVFSRRPISLIMDRDPLIVDYNTPINHVSKCAMSRVDSKVYDCVIVTKDTKYYGLVTIKNLLEFTTELEKNYAKELNPLTGLPGNMIIDRSLNEIRNLSYPCCALYFDLDNFKAYNDIYGFENGDRLLKFTSELLKNQLKRYFPCNSFLGHIGGDDFICTIESTLDKCESFSNNLLLEFDKNILSFFNEKDQCNGYLVAKDRDGVINTFDLTSLSIAGIYGDFSYFSTSKDIAKLASKIKKEAKSIKGSSFVLKEISSIEYEKINKVPS